MEQISESNIRPAASALPARSSSQRQLSDISELVDRLTLRWLGHDANHQDIVARQLNVLQTLSVLPPLESALIASRLVQALDGDAAEVSHFCLVLERAIQGGTVR